jgi:RNA polymerase-binding transcription factor DksA
VPRTTCKPTELFRSILEEQFQTHTNRLIELTRCGRLPHRGGYELTTLNMLIAAARQDLADTAQALRRMARGTFGVCERCRNDIPLGRLRATPQARFCVPCHRT